MPETRRPPIARTPGWITPIVLAVVLVPFALQAILHPDRPSPDAFMPWIVCIAVFAIADAVGSRRPPDRWAALALAVASVCACTATWLIPAVYGGASLTASLLVATAARLHRFPRRVAWTWIVLQTLLLGAIYIDRWGFEIGLSVTLGFFGFQAIGHGFSRTASSEARARDELARTLEDLKDARERLTETARRAERNQIAADLHDILGHHLIALRLQIEAARSDETDHHLERASQLSRLLLAEVRGVVDELQDRKPFDWRTAVHALEEDRTQPRISVRIESGDLFDALDPAAARSLFRAIQEAVTNARKHAQAAHVQIVIDEGGIRVEDDGRSWSGPLEGRGLRGLESRCEAAGASLTIDRREGQGTTVTMRPLPASASTMENAR